MPSLAARRGLSLAWTCLALGWMLGPESLVTLGRGAGQLGLVFVALVVVWGAVHFTTAPGVTTRPGGIWDASLALAGRMVVAVCGVTLILARAGYVFNEIFVYWFPNLAFSFCLLALVAGLNLAWPRAADRAQVLFVAVVVIGLAALIVIGLFNWASVESGTAAGESVSGGDLVPLGLAQTVGWPEAASRSVMLGATLFIGYDLAGFRPTNSIDDRGDRPGYGPALFLGAAVFVVWGLVSWASVPPVRLAGSTVPYAPVAWRLAGQTGQIIIGVVMLGSCLAAANALLNGATGNLAGLSRDGCLPWWLARRIPLVLVPGLGVAALLGLGYAGEPVTAVYLDGGIGLWLLLYAVQAWTRTPTGIGSRVAGLALAGAAIGLIGTDAEPVRLAVFMAAAWGAALVLIGATRLISRPRPAGTDSNVNPNRRMGK